MKLSQVVPEVILLAQAISDFWETELPKRHPDYPLEHPGDDSGPPPPEEKTLRELLERLPEDAVYKLVLLMHLGRWEFGTDKLAAEYQALKERYETREWAISRMMETPPLGEELLDGLQELKKAGIDVDKMTFKTAKTRK